MKNLFILLITASILVLPQTMSGQKISVSSGNLKFLKDQKHFNLNYEYEGMAVGKFDKEEEYIEERVAKLNGKEAGAGDKWREGWFADREERYHPKFEELLNVNLGKSASASHESGDAIYTIILKTVFTEPGFNIGVVRKNASIDVEIHFVKTGTDTPLAVMEMKKVPGRGGMGYDFDTGFRLQEAYAKCGKELGKYLVKKAL